MVPEFIVNGNWLSESSLCLVYVYTNILHGDEAFLWEVSKRYHEDTSHSKADTLFLNSVQAEFLSRLLARPRGDLTPCVQCSGPERVYRANDGRSMVPRLINGHFYYQSIENIPSLFALNNKYGVMRLEIDDQVPVGHMLFGVRHSCLPKDFIHIVELPC